MKNRDVPEPLFQPIVFILAFAAVTVMAILVTN
jgi:hypothetical protein